MREQGGDARTAFAIALYTPCHSPDPRPLCFVASATENAMPARPRSVHRRCLSKQAVSLYGNRIRYHGRPEAQACLGIQAWVQSRGKTAAQISVLLQILSDAYVHPHQQHLPGFLRPIAPYYPQH